MASPPRSVRQQRRAKRTGRRKAVFGGVAAVILVTALVGGYVAFAGGDDDPKVTTERPERNRTPSSVDPSTIPAPPPGHSYVATAKDTVTQVEVFDEPDSPLSSKQYPNPWLLNDDPESPIKQVYLVERVSEDGNWLHVFLPERPNGTLGWVRASDFTVTENPYNISIDLADRVITVREGQEAIYKGPVATGSDTPLPDSGGRPTPTPAGIYYIRVLLETDDPSSVYGPFAYGLSAHSETLDTYNGGDAEVGIHGNNDPSVLGKSVTHGCIRMDNEEITKLTKILPLGTPVVIN